MLKGWKLRCSLWATALAAQACVLNPHGEDPSINPSGSESPVGEGNIGNGGPGGDLPGAGRNPPPETTSDPVEETPENPLPDDSSAPDAGALPNPDAARRGDAGLASELADAAPAEAP